MSRPRPFFFLFLSALVTCPAAASESQHAAQEIVHKDILIKNEVETAISMLEALDVKRQQGEMSLQQAKELGAYLLQSLRYGKEGYFWADTEEGVNVVLYGRKDVEGKSRIDAKDPYGVAYIRKFIELGKAGGGYADYWFPKKGASKPLPKRSYVMPFKPFGWVVGSGYYRSTGGQ